MELFSSDNKVKRAPLIVLISQGNEAKEVSAILKTMTQQPFALLEVPVSDWNDDLSPWPSPPLFKGSKAFGGKADAFLFQIEGILEQIERKLASEGMEVTYRALAGYSLAGLFALYAGYSSRRFEKIISASGSLWYPDFSAFTKEKELSECVNAVYLSLGDRESQSRNPLRAQVEKKTAEIAKDLGGKVKTVYEINPGNHFKDPERRLAKGIAWILNN